MRPPMFTVRMRLLLPELILYSYLSQASGGAFSYDIPPSDRVRFGSKVPRNGLGRDGGAFA